VKETILDQIDRRLEERNRMQNSGVNTDTDQRAFIVWLPSRDPSTKPNPHPPASLTRQKDFTKWMLVAALATVLSQTTFGEGPRVHFQYQLLKPFGASGISPGTYITGKMIEGRDGKLYGMTGDGGINDVGTIFSLNKDGSGYALLHSFSGEDGAHPAATWDMAPTETTGAVLLEGGDGALYGTTRDGGSNGLGTVFKLNKDGSAYVVLHHFSGADEDGGIPQVGLLEGSDGVLYGATSAGGSNSLGTVFSLNTDGSSYRVFRFFSQSDFGFVRVDPVPNSALVEGSDGALYGTVAGSGTQGHFSAVFKIRKDGSSFAVLDSFGRDKGMLVGGMMAGSDGALYGATSASEEVTNPFGAIFKLNMDGSGYSMLHSFGETAGDGQYPATGLFEGSDGALYGTTTGGGSEGLGTLFTLNKDGGGYTVVFNSSTEQSLGQNPLDELWNTGFTEGTDGALYGTAGRGPEDDALPPRLAVIKLNKDGSGYTFLHAFSPSDEGARPAGLTEGSDKALYGTTHFGGSNDLGTVFKVQRDGSGYTVLHHFGFGGDGRYPQAALFEGSDGVLYGTTDHSDSTNLGTLFRLNKDGSGYAVVHRFTGKYPPLNNYQGYLIAPLVEGSDGALYGATVLGDITNAGGTVFKLNKDGSNYRVLHSFDFWSGDGAWPRGPVLQGSDGALYGTTSLGPVTNETYSWGAGTIFKLNKDGSDYVILRSFTGLDGDGAGPLALREGTDGALYGTTSNGGNNHGGITYGGVGTIFRINKDGGEYRIVHVFEQGSDGAYPSSLYEGSDGAFYGTTLYNNVIYPYNGGTIFRLNRDGTGYTVVQGFPTNLVSSAYYFLELALAGRDGALHMMQPYGGPRGLGALFAFKPQPVMLPPVPSGPAVLVPFTCMPGTVHQLQRAGTLAGPWLTLTNLLVATNGVVEFTDSEPLQAGGFYRTMSP
jgi:uncharacterized repeat protein (TIGR03803 family)